MRASTHGTMDGWMDGVSVFVNREGGLRQGEGGVGHLILCSKKNPEMLVLNVSLLQR